MEGERKSTGHPSDHIWRHFSILTLSAVHKKQTYVFYGRMLVVYPGVDGTAQWTGRWEGEYEAICSYPSVETIWNEWESGVQPYVDSRIGVCG